MSLKNKQILITAGPTWVAIDKIRVISNIATGETGILLAKKLSKLAAKVTLFLGPVPNVVSLRGLSAGSLRETKAKIRFGISLGRVNNKFKIVNFIFFNELKDALKKELSRKKYDFIIHSAAVADFKPKIESRGKLSSDKIYHLKLYPLPKIIKEIRTLNPQAKLVMFKLEAGLNDKTLIKKAILARNKIGAEIVVANRLNPYRAFIINKENKIIAVKDKKELTNKLIFLLKQN